MHPRVTELFELMRSSVKEQDILDFSPSDPGYQDYVRVWTQVWRNGEIPRESAFDLSEVIALTGYADASKQREPERFRRYRRFTSAVGVALLHYGNASESVSPPNYLARALLIDIEPASGLPLRMLRELFLATRDILASNNEEQYPFFTFGSMILAQRSGDYGASARSASRLIEDEGRVRANNMLAWMVEDERFLLGITNYNQFHEDWLDFAAQLKNPNHHGDTQLVIDALANNRR